MRIREGARPDADLLAAAEASLVACALDEDLMNAPKHAEALAPRLRGAARRALARRVLLKHDVKAAANMLRAAGLDRPDLQAKDACVLATASAEIKYLFTVRSMTIVCVALTVDFVSTALGPPALMDDIHTGECRPGLRAARDTDSGGGAAGSVVCGPRVERRAGRQY